MKKLIVLGMLVFVGTWAHAQYRYTPLSWYNRMAYELSTHEAIADSSLHDSVWPKFATTSNAVTSRIDSGSWLRRKLFHEPLIMEKSGLLEATINPVIIANVGRDVRSQEDELLSPNTRELGRGLHLEGKIGDRVSYYLLYIGIEERFPLYIDDYINRNQAVPGVGNYKGNAKSVRDHFYNMGAVSVKAASWLDITFGQGKNFFGSGYRSMILSDNAAPYPFLRMESTFGKFKYVNLYTQMSNATDRDSDAFHSKWNVMHLLSWNASEKLSFNFFESIVWSNTTGENSTPMALFNPVIIYRPVEFSQGSRAGNGLVGWGVNWQAHRHMKVYGQFMLDELRIQSLIGSEKLDWTNKFGVQLGVKGTMEKANHKMFYRLEANAVRPYTYAHKDTLKNFGHFNQPIAHPLGANFYEGIGQLHWSKNRSYVTAQVNYIHQGLDEEGNNWGSSILKSYSSRVRDDGNYVGQGNTSNRWIGALVAGYMLNPASGLCAEISLRHRAESLGGTRLNSTQVSIGIRSTLYSRYLDF